MSSIIQKWGNSQAIRIPKPILQIALLKENDKVEIIASENEIIIKKVVDKNKHITLKERLKNYDGTYEFEEWNTGSPAGNEVF